MLGMDRKAVARGSSSNPANRFVPLQIDLDGEPDPDDVENPPALRTTFLRDASRTVIARNDSPDVGFEASVNPYRGCEHGCTYCVSEETPILVANGSTKPIGDVRVGDEVYGTVRRGFYRRYVRTRVLAHWRTVKPAYRVRLAEGTELTASGDHRFLTERGWKAVALPGRSSLTVHNELRGFGAIPAGTRRRSIEGQAVKSAANLKVESVEPIGPRALVDITTGTEDFIANGVVAHNCYARPTHEYLGMSAGLDFETKILVKEDAPELLREELQSKRWKPTVVAMSGVTDCYQPVERKLRLTRRCLEVLAEFRNPVCIITKNALVARDADVLGTLAQHQAAVVHVSVTSLDRELQRRLEPRTSPPALRLDAVKRLNDAGVPAGVLIAPVIPGLNDHEIPAILEAAARAGAVSAGYVVLRLPYAVKDLFEEWLERHAPDRKNKVLHRIQALRGGRLNDPRFGTRMSGEGIFAEQIAMLFEAGRRKAGLREHGPKLSTDAFRRPDRGQLSLFPS
jgi:DNA repair photolyase